MNGFPHTHNRRRGATVPLFAILCVPLLGMLAFSIDVGWIALVRTDLQTTADAAALAGAEQLQQLYVQYFSAGQTQANQKTIFDYATTNTTLPAGYPYYGAPSPMLAAEQVAVRNKAGNVYIQVQDSDVVFSYNDGNGNYYQNYQALGLDGGFPNAITVTTRRDSTLNSPVSLFFGPIFGWTNKPLEASATATIQPGEATSLQIVQGGTVGPHVLPVALDYNIWTNFYKSGGKSPDGNVYAGPNGAPQLYVYANGPWVPSPTTLGSVSIDTSGGSSMGPGSFGLLDLGPPSTNAPAFRNWIDNGPTPNDIGYLTSSGLLPVSLSSSGVLPGPKQWTVGTGLKSTLLTNFQSQLEVPNLIPLFIPGTAPAWWGSALSTGSYQAISGNGSTATYAIVGFVAVTISQASGTGSNMNISIQPMALVDPTAVLSNLAPAGTQPSQYSTTINGPTITTFSSAKLTQ